MTFTIICNECDMRITLCDGDDKNIYPIKISGSVEALYEADVYIDCECGNSITVSKKS